MENVNGLEKSQVLWKAFLFSGLVMLGGAVVWGILYALGLFSAWIAFLSTWIAVIVYVKFYDKIDWKAYLWIIALTIILNIISLFIAIGVSVSVEAEVSLASALKALISVLKSDVDLMVSMLGDMLYTIVFSVLGTILGIKYRKKKLATDAEIREAQKNIQQVQSQSVEQDEPDTEKN